MKLVKSLLLGSAAGIAAVASAQAADLPTRKAAPVEYVRVCDAFGAGFFYIPGTDSCIRISGRVRAEYSWTNTRAYGTPVAAGTTFALNTRTGAVVPTVVAPGTFNVNSGQSLDQIGLRARGRMNFDVRTQTSWGVLRTYVRYELTHNTGGTYNTGDTSSLSYGFIQFAGITAGRAQSMFDFYANNWNYGTLRGSDNNPNLLAYTATFGGGFSATISLEDPTDRGWSVTNVGAATAAMTGVRYPDVIGALRVDQGWGSAQLSGAYGNRTTYASTRVGAYKKDYDTWAVKGGLQLNLPMLAAGDQLWVEATYAKGNAAYLGGSTYSRNAQNGIRTGYLGSNAGNFGGFPDAIAYIPAGAANYSITMNKGWSALAAFQHYWTPSFRSVLMGSYLDLDYDNAANALGYRGTREWRVGGQLIWSPVKNFDIGLELMYAKADNRVTPAMAAAIRAAGIKKDPDSIEARLRLQRDF